MFNVNLRLVPSPFLCFSLLAGRQQRSCSLSRFGGFGINSLVVAVIVTRAQGRTRGRCTLRESRGEEEEEDEFTFNTEKLYGYEKHRLNSAASCQTIKRSAGRTFHDNFVPRSIPLRLKREPDNFLYNFRDWEKYVNPVSRNVSILMSRLVTRRDGQWKPRGWASASDVAIYDPVDA